MDDLKVAFPPIAHGFQQLLDYDGADIESAFGLCMQVTCMHALAALCIAMVRLPSGGDAMTECDAATGFSLLGGV